MKKQEKFIKPTQFAEKKIIQSILSKQLKVGDNLLPERELALQLGITRPTLREVLQRLSRDGWIRITHGKPTIINDYQNDGGLGILKSMVKNEAIISTMLMLDWLEFRTFILPDLGFKAVLKNENEILKILSERPKLNSSKEAFAIFDWDLQMALIKNSSNEIAKMLYNDISEIYHKESSQYFSSTKTKRLSITFYNKLNKSILEDKKQIKEIILKTMQESLNIWKKNLKNHKK